MAKPACCVGRALLSSQRTHWCGKGTCSLSIMVGTRDREAVLNAVCKQIEGAVIAHARGDRVGSWCAMIMTSPRFTGIVTHPRPGELGSWGSDHRAGPDV